MEINIANKKIGDNHPVFIIAELSANHLQKFELAVETVKAIKEAGADAVKLQTYTPDTITIDSDNEYFQIKQGVFPFSVCGEKHQGRGIAYRRKNHVYKAGIRITSKIFKRCSWEKGQI